MSNNLNKNRLAFIDVARALGIIFMIIGHTAHIPNLLFIIIYSFHMPLFFFLSGLTFKNNNASWQPFIHKKFKRFIVPYFFMAFICYFIFVILKALIFPTQLTFLYFLKPLGGIIYSIGTTKGLPNCSPLWFLTALFCTEMIFYCITLYTEKSKLKIIFYTTLSGVLGYLISTYSKCKLPWNIDSALIAVVFMGGGFLLKDFIKYISLKNPLSWFSLILAIAINYLSIRFSNYTLVNMDINQYHNILWFYLGAFAGIYVLIILSKLLESVCFLEKLGQITMPIIGFNYALNTLVTYILNSTNFYFLLFGNLIAVILLLVIVSKFKHTKFISTHILGYS